MAYVVDLIFQVVKLGGLEAWSDHAKEYFQRHPIDSLFSVGFIIIAIYLGIVMLKLPKYYQAAIGWWITKPVLALVCFIFLIAGGLVGFFRGAPDALHVTLFSLLWIPGIEFINKVTEKQKFITIGRLILSVPILFLWYQTGTWH